MKPTVAGFLLTGHFKFKTMQEADSLAAFLSEICPNATLAHMGLCELFTNAIEHGNLNITPEEKHLLQQEGRWLEEIERRLTLTENQIKWVNVYTHLQEDLLQIKVVDEGLGFDWQHYQSNQEKVNLETRGRGILMAQNLAFKSLRYQGCGNEVIAVIELSPGRTQRSAPTDAA